MIGGGDQSYLCRVPLGKLCTISRRQVTVGAGPCLAQVTAWHIAGSPNGAWRATAPADWPVLCSDRVYCDVVDDCRRPGSRRRCQRHPPLLCTTCPTQW